MLSFRLLTLTCMALTAWGALPNTAEACSPDPCADSNRWQYFSLASLEVAPDGVLRFSGRTNGFADTADTLEYVSLAVFDETGAEVLGALEFHEELNAFAWRPQEQFEASAQYTATLFVDNDALGLALDDKWISEKSGCGPNIDEALSFETTADLLPALSLPEPEMVQEHWVSVVDELESMVCCDGAYPYEDADSCGFAEIRWDEGQCGSTLGSGLLNVEATISMDDVAPVMRSNLVVRLVQVDGPRTATADPGNLSASFAFNEPFCAQLQAFDLANGAEWSSSEVCFGDELAGELGLHEIDPSAQLAECVGQPYVCQTSDKGGPFGRGWESENCEPWGGPPGTDESGDESGGSGDEGDGSGDGDGDGDGGSGDDGATGDGTAGGNDGLDDRGCSCSANDRGDSTVAGLWMLVAMLGFGGGPNRRNRRRNRRRYR